MADLTTQSPVAQDAVPRLGTEPYRGAMMLRGYLDITLRVEWNAAGQAIGAVDRRLYTDNSLNTWYEFDVDDLLHHMPGGVDPDSPMGAVWIASEGVVTKCTRGYANTVAYEDSMAHDPAAGPTPPYRGPTPPYR